MQASNAQWVPRGKYGNNIHDPKAEVGQYIDGRNQQVNHDIASKLPYYMYSIPLNMAPDSCPVTPLLYPIAPPLIRTVGVALFPNLRSRRGLVQLFLCPAKPVRSQSPRPKC